MVVPHVWRFAAYKEAWLDSMRFAIDGAADGGKEVESWLGNQWPRISGRGGGRCAALTTLGVSFIMIAIGAPGGGGVDGHTGACAPIEKQNRSLFEAV
jgi:hypothetical protein